MALLDLWIAQSMRLKLAGFGLRRDFCNRCSRWSPRGRTKVDLDFSYLVSFDGEEVRVPGSAVILDFAVVEECDHSTRRSAMGHGRICGCGHLLLSCV